MSSNVPDEISNGLNEAADITDAINQEAGINTGKMSFWLRLGSMLAKFGASFARKK